MGGRTSDMDVYGNGRDDSGRVGPLATACSLGIPSQKQYIKYVKLAKASYRKHGLHRLSSNSAIGTRFQTPK